MIYRFVYRLLLGLLLSAAAHAELTIEITSGSDQPVAIAVVPFGWTGRTVLKNDVSAIVSSDLHRSGQFAPLQPDEMLSQPHRAKDVHYRDWRSLGVDYVLVGNVSRQRDGQFRVNYELLDVHSQQVLSRGERAGSEQQLRDMAHYISDRVYEKITNIKGAFSTKLLYVSAVRQASGQTIYRLLLSDIDGAREKVLLQQTEPILTPSWAPNGKIIAYVSFETTRPGIYLHNLETGQRKQLTNFRGINGAPVWSPDGSKLAMVLSKDGSPDIYVMDLKTQVMKRITRHFAIDTEPDWMPDGQSLIFTSDRGGKPQIYKANINGGGVERMTFEGDYNARARVLPGGEGLIMVHRAGKGQDFHIALLDFKRGSVIGLTETQLDESPSIAPNGTILLYATKRAGRGVLAAVSVDGDVHYLLPSKYGDVREPAWSPFLGEN